MKLLKFIINGSEPEGLMIVILSVIAGISGGIIVILYSDAAVNIFSKKNYMFYLMTLPPLTVVHLLSSRISQKRAASLSEQKVGEMILNISNTVRCMELPEFEQHCSSDIYMSIAEAQSISRAATRNIEVLQNRIILFVTWFYIVFFLSPLLGLCLLLWQFFVILMGDVGLEIIGAFHREESEKQSDLFSMFRHVLYGFKELKFNKKKDDDLFIAYLSPLTEMIGNIRIKAGIYNSEMRLVYMLSLFLLLCGGIFWGGKIPVSSLILIFYMMRTDIQTIMMFSDISKGNTVLEKLESMFEREKLNLPHEDAEISDRKEIQSFDALTMENICFAYPGNGDRAGFSVSADHITIRSGEILFITGGNGSGKSTLMKIITGLYPPDSGEIKIDGLAVSMADRRYLFSAVFADFHLFDRLYGLEEIDESRIQELLRLTELEGKTAYRNGSFTTLELSTGQKKRLALVIALLEDRPLYIFDEWAADQDPHFRSFFYTRILPELKQRGKTVIGVTHDDRYFHIADQVVRMEYGKITQVLYSEEKKAYYSPAPCHSERPSPCHSERSEESHSSRAETLHCVQGDSKECSGDSKVCSGNSKVCSGDSKVCHSERPSPCHSERSEESHSSRAETLHCVQGDSKVCSSDSKVCHSERPSPCHSERSEESHSSRAETLHCVQGDSKVCVQGDSKVCSSDSKVCHSERPSPCHSERPSPCHSERSEESAKKDRKPNGFSGKFATILREEHGSLRQIAFLLLSDAALIIALMTLILYLGITGVADKSGMEQFKYFLFILILSLLFVIADRRMSKAFFRLFEKKAVRLRLNIIRCVRKTDLLTLEETGPGKIFTALTSDIREVIDTSKILTSCVVGALRIALIFICVGLLSLPAFLLLLLAALVGCYFYVANHSQMMECFDQVRDQENRLFSAVGDLLGGFKELRLNDRKSSDFYHRGLGRHVSAMQELRIRYLHCHTNTSSIIYASWYLALLIITLGLPFTAASPYILMIIVGMLVTMPLNHVVSFYSQFHQAYLSLRRLLRLEETMENFVAESVVKASPEELSRYKHMIYENLSFAFRAKDGHPFTAGPLNFRCLSGEVIFITGGNGSGKTTLLRLLTGLYDAASCRFLVNGKEADIRAYRELFAPIFTDFHLFDRLYGMTVPLGEKESEKLSGLLRRFDLEKRVTYSDGKFSTLDLSTGQRKRLALVTVMMEDRPIYIFDEWAADQDPHFREYFYHTLIPEFKAQGKTVIAVTHDDRYFHLPDRLVKMEYGQIVEN